VTASIVHPHSRARHPVVLAVREFVEREVKPVAPDLDHADAYPHALVERMRELGLFGSLVPREHGGLGLAVSDYARVIEELCRGWMSLAGVINSHTMMALIALRHGTDEQRARWLPRMARGELRGGLALTEPHAGSDVQAIRTVAQRDGDHYLVSGSKMFITNGREGNALALLARTDPAATPPHRGMSCFIIEKGGPGWQVVGSIAKLGYKGVDTVELLFERFAVPAGDLVGGVEGRGFQHVMSGLETGRINIAARCVGVAQAVLEEVERQDGAPPGEARASAARESMRARVEAARALVYWAGAMKDRAERCDLEAGMAKLYASETAQVVATDAIRLLGPRSQRLDATLERHYRDTPLMIIGEGANEIQRTLIARQLVDRHGERPGALTSRDGEPDERRQLVLAVRQFVDKEIAPAAQEQDGRGALPAALVERLAELGVFGALLPPAAGGLDLDLVTAAMIVEEVARGWGALGWALARHLAVSGALADGPGAAGNPAIARMLPALARGEILGAPAPLGRAALAPGRPALLAIAEDAAPGSAGATCRLVRSDDPRVRLVPEPAALGLRSLGRAAVAVDASTGAVVPVAARVRDVATLGEAAVAVGIAQAAFEAALRYSQQRTTFGKPISQHQAIQLKLADMASAIAAARLLTGAAAEAPGEGAAARARQLAAETAAAVTLEAMRVHGGYGYTREFPVERHYRDAAALLAEASAARPATA
jgi:alkylation response protein AidB-like acyl-CoA dehydrogenase